MDRPPNQILHPSNKMEGLLLLLAAEVAVSTSLAHLQRKARGKVLQKWYQGSLTLEELQVLKRMKWFQQLWKPTSKIPSSEKKND
jgi:hypothetical protein